MAGAVEGVKGATSGIITLGKYGAIIIGGGMLLSATFGGAAAFAADPGLLTLGQGSFEGYKDGAVWLGELAGDAATSGATETLVSSSSTMAAPVFSSATHVAANSVTFSGLSAAPVIPPITGTEIVSSNGFVSVPEPPL